jgi:hypothetical protein
MVAHGNSDRAANIPASSIILFGAAQVKIRKTSRALGIGAATVLLMGCGAQGAIQPTIGVPSTPKLMRKPGDRPFQPAMAPGESSRGIYVSSSDGTIKAFSMTGKRLLCTIKVNLWALDDIAVDPKGNLLVPLGHPHSSGSVVIYRGQLQILIGT